MVLHTTQSNHTIHECNRSSSGTVDGVQRGSYVLAPSSIYQIWNYLTPLCGLWILAVPDKIIL